MLRVHCVQLFYNLSDPAMEDMLYEVESVPRFCDISLEKVPDESTILNFRHRLEHHGLGRKLFERISENLAKQGLLLKEGREPLKKLESDTSGLSTSPVATGLLKC